MVTLPCPDLTESLEYVELVLRSAEEGAVNSDPASVSDRTEEQSTVDSLQVHVLSASTVCTVALLFVVIVSINTLNRSSIFVRSD